MTRPLRIRIEQLVLHGFDPRDRHAIDDAVRRELARLFASGDSASRNDATIPHLRDTNAIARQIAQETHQAVKSLPAAPHNKVPR